MLAFCRCLAHGRNIALTAVSSAPGPSAASTSPSTTPSDDRGDAPVAALRGAVLASLDDDKAVDVVEIDLAGKSSVTDVMIIASGRSQRHVGAIADHVLRRVKDAGVKNVRVEGLAAADWVLIDAGDVVVHLFRPEVREFYNLERLWEAEADSARATG